MRYMQTESVLQTKNRSGPAKNRFSVALNMVQRKPREGLVLDFLETKLKLEMDMCQTICSHNRNKFHEGQLLGPVWHFQHM